MAPGNAAATKSCPHTVTVAGATHGAVSFRLMTPSMCPAFVPWIFYRDLFSRPPEYSPPIATAPAHRPSEA